MSVRMMIAVCLCLVAATVPVPAQSELVIVKKGGAEYHRPGCEAIADGVDVLAMTRAQADGRKLTAHAACDPARAAASTETGSPAKTAPVFVYVDATAKHYHREKCARLGKGEKKVALEVAALKHWPCTICKPPIRKRPRR